MLSSRRSLTLAALVGLAALCVVPRSPAGEDGPVADHLKCFQIRDELGEQERRTVLLTDLLPAQAPPFAAQTCKIRLPASHLCIDVVKENVLFRGTDPFETLPVAGAPARKYLCYRMRCPRETVELEARDQFAERVIQTRKGSFLCMPAEDADGATPTPTVTPPPPSETPTGTATVTPTATATVTPSATPTATATPTGTVTATPTSSVTASATPTPTMTMTPEVAPTPTATATVTPTLTVTASATPTPTPTFTPEPIPTAVPCQDASGPTCDGTCPTNQACLFDSGTESCTCQDVGCSGPPSTGGICSALCPDAQICAFDGEVCRCVPPEQFCGGTIPLPDGNGTCNGFCVGVGMQCLPIAGGVGVGDGIQFCGCFQLE